MCRPSTCSSSSCCTTTSNAVRLRLRQTRHDVRIIPSVCFQAFVVSADFEQVRSPSEWNAVGMQRLRISLHVRHVIVRREEHSVVVPTVPVTSACRRGEGVVREKVTVHHRGTVDLEDGGICRETERTVVRAGRCPLVSVVASNAHDDEWRRSGRRIMCHACIRACAERGMGGFHHSGMKPPVNHNHLAHAVQRAPGGHHVT